jgi:hypothetical protein
MRALLAVVALAAFLPSAGGSAAQRGFEFGRIGGNIRPYSVAIANNGRVHVTGPVAVGRTTLTPLQIAGLNRVATSNRFTTLAAVTNCPGTLPDVAATFIRVGARTVRVHGSCLTRYQHVWTALTRAVKLASG